MKRTLPLHDAGFDGIVTTAEKVTLYFTRSDGVGCTVVLRDVRALQMEDFRQGNIVMAFEVTTGEVPDAEGELDRLYPAPHPSAAPEYHAQYTDFVQSELKAVEAGELNFVSMVPAYGADLLAVCGSVESSEYTMSASHP